MRTMGPMLNCDALLSFISMTIIITVLVIIIIKAHNVSRGYLLTVADPDMGGLGSPQ